MRYPYHTRIPHRPPRGLSPRKINGRKPARYTDHTAATLDAPAYEIIPAQPYTQTDLSWTDDGSRVNAEHENPLFKQKIQRSLQNIFQKM
ncbi:MAG: hypothetical protein HFE98_02160 [Ruminiclostridium sp.]|nr:hypothetical protein [Ruminiclostridium sp.]